VAPYIVGGLFLAAAAWTDWRARKVPLALTAGGLLAALLARGLGGGWSAVAEGLAGAALLGGLALVPPLVTRGRGWGGGDVLAFLVVGAAFGAGPGLRIVETGLVVGAVLSLGALALRLTSRRTPLPLVTFLFLGALLSLPP
jgi:prepilin peptidase CpaA